MTGHGFILLIEHDLVQGQQVLDLGCSHTLGSKEPLERRLANKCQEYYVLGSRVREPTGASGFKPDTIVFVTHGSCCPLNEHTLKDHLGQDDGASLVHGSGENFRNHQLVHAHHGGTAFPTIFSLGWGNKVLLKQRRGTLQSCSEIDVAVKGVRLSAYNAKGKPHYSQPGRQSGRNSNGRPPVILT
ncbi:hypothetical protein M514_00691 [Trichuris suis]|uniref:Uncharacterized protein n=1 Tax=Trichuris suis TaxID=68888 RepID=A0A085N6J7_9BILA|nr:hypothetical protein M514_00691 [Trichuris suis]